MRADQESLLRQLEAMPDFLERVFASLSPWDAVTAVPNGSFSPIEQCWHLADLEREGYGVRIHRLLAEDDPRLPDFDGDRVAEERNYKSLSLADGIKAFRKARTANVRAFRSVSNADWSRPGTQEGVGRMMLGDVPAMMAEHDASHRKEIEAWARAWKERLSTG
jgi:hypothetical protein